MSLISVDEALGRLLSDIKPLEGEEVPLAEANGRILAAPLSARRTQPPFPASAMDGYAVRAADIMQVPADLKIIGEAPAGHGFSGSIGPGETVRIFTGAPVPEGADTILIQENARRDGNRVTALEALSQGSFVRKAGLDFVEGQELLTAGRRLNFRDIALAAAMNHACVPVVRKPRIAILATGDELVLPGQNPGADQIIASNSFGVAAFVEDCGGIAVDLGIAADTEEALAEKIRKAADAKVDILVTLGGASVGDHDLVQDALGAEGMELAFWRIAMRPGKPLMAGHIGPMRVLGLPGNPVSSLVCSLLFLKPLLFAIQGADIPSRKLETARLGTDLGENDRREDYLRARLSRDEHNDLVATAFGRQDSSMLATMTAADALIVRSPYAPAAKSGEIVPILRLDSR
ncbi:molybdopterin molybdotransferase MoeA [Rhizobiales bacterium]|uniref:molybdopterin molybdotransferase MoeA n=1 Tax=Hongsoonwoonella zoysiae TaxID=2821844 RepID=UPI001560C9C4|nr:gephyrin-like molybdotransferase Glp [Hongsoonwoonella zoysiae]NRG18712.1 molybdopterin molybdotransferase MoeA [Hongsoonwoonella zoysiae]